MNQNAIYCAGTTAAAACAREFLRQSGFTIHSLPQRDTGHVLLDVPSFQGDVLRDGRSPDTLLSALDSHTVLWGGGMTHPSLSGFRTKDLLQDALYLAENAAITADCAIRLAAPMLRCIWKETPVLVLGWGRIGKCLGSSLKAMGCPVTIAARKPEDLAVLFALGYDALPISQLSQYLPGFRLVFNTVPEMILPESQNTADPDCLMMDLASRNGIEGDRVIQARGLPGIHAPESSGKLIAKTMMRMLKEET